MAPGAGPDAIFDLRWMLIESDDLWPERRSAPGAMLEQVLVYFQE
jgi:hypothetical protein